jgi:hypothetical protein
MSERITDERLAGLVSYYDALGDAGYSELLSALRELARRRELSGPMAPIARVTVENCGVYETIHEVVRTTLYAPGLPEGDHNLYPEPPQHDDLRRDLEEARDELASLREQVRWIPVTERLPIEPGQYLTIITPTARYLAPEQKRWITDFNGSEFELANHRVTLWQSIPALPEGEG